MKIVFLSMEMLIPEFPELNRGANFVGGLGILAGDIMSGLARTQIDGLGIVPFYRRNWKNGQEINYDFLGQPIFEIEVEIGSNCRRHKIKVWRVKRGGQDLYGLECPEIFDYLYTGDRWKRFEQELLVGKAVPEILKRLKIKPDIVWLNESHTLPVIPEIKEDSYFQGVKILFTIHTPVPDGLERYPKEWFKELRIDGRKYHFFIKNDCLDFAWAAMALADLANGVSAEHGQVTKEMFPDFAQKIIGIKNGSDRELWLSHNLQAIENNLTPENLWLAHQADKKEFIEFIANKTGVRLNFNKPIFVAVRRFVPYKNQCPMLKDIIRAICLDRNKQIETPLGWLSGLGLQVVLGGIISDSRCYHWAEEFGDWMRDPELRGKFLHINDYSFDLLLKGARGSDVWFSAPWLKWEACGTSDQRAAMNGIINLTSKTGGAMEYIKEFSSQADGGNGFYIEPYEPRTIYEKLKIISSLYYAHQENNDKQWLKLMQNVFEVGKKLDITLMIEEYKEKLFVPLTK